MKNHLLAIGFSLALLLACSSSQENEQTADRVAPQARAENWLGGRLPGENWLEHNPPRFSARQSFETRTPLNQSLLLLYIMPRADGESFSQKLVAGQSSDWYETGQGRWQIFSFQKKNHFVQFYLLTRENYLVWVEFIAPGRAEQALYGPDVKKYVREIRLGE